MDNAFIHDAMFSPIALQWAFGFRLSVTAGYICIIVFGGCYETDAQLLGWRYITELAVYSE